jgi:branched-chain amino acid transport system substrate-binding protein
MHRNIQVTWNRSPDEQRSFMARAVAVGAALTALTVATAACSSSSTSSSGGTAAAAGSGGSAPGVSSSTIKIGLLTSFTGPLAATFNTVATGFEARIALQNAQGGVNGRKIQIVDGDDQGAASSALAAAKTLVEQDGVFAIGGLGTYVFAASSYLQQQDIPVVGYSIDGGPEWAQPYTNTVAVLGSPNPSRPAAVAWGSFLKSHGATSVAAVGAAAPSAQVIAKNIVASAKAAGLKAPYLNTTIPLSQTAGFDSVVQAIKSSGADAVTMSQGTAADLGLLSAIQQAGLKLKVILVLPAVPGKSINNAQVKTELADTWSGWPVLPPIQSTTSNKVITNALATYEKQTTQPDQNELAAWASADAVIKGLQAAGKNPTRQTFLTSLKGMTAFDGGGTSLGNTNISAAFGAGAQDAGPAPGDCIAFTQFVGSRYEAPTTVCGGLVPNSDAS